MAMRNTKTLSVIAAWLLAFSPSSMLCASPGQESAPAADTGNPTEAAPQSASELQALVAPIALYPDSLVAQVLTASTFPDQVAIADYWLQQNKRFTGSALMQAVDKQSWDASVKALTEFPSVLEDMAKNLAWTNGSLVADFPRFPNLGVSGGGYGVADLWVQPFTLGWHLKRADIQVGDAFMVPTGRYSPGATNNIGTRYCGNHLQTGTTFYLTKNKGTSVNPVHGLGGTRTAARHEQHLQDAGAGLHRRMGNWADSSAQKRFQQTPATRLQERVVKLVGGVAIIKVGATTETELKEKKAR